MAQVAIPVAGSTSRKLGQPFVRQKGRPVDWAVVERRRNRRMELARPAYDAVAVLDIMWCCSLFFLARAAGGLSLRSDPRFLRFTRR